MNFNKFKSTAIYGNFYNLDNTGTNVIASAEFQRDLTIKNNLYLGNETVETICNNQLDASGNVMLDVSGNPITYNSHNYTDTGGAICFKLQNVLYTISPNDLIKLKENLANTTYIDNKFTDFINGASPAYDTLKEISDYINANTQEVSNILSNLSTKASIGIVSSLATDITNISANINNLPTITYVDTGFNKLTSSINLLNSNWETNFENVYTKDYINANYYTSIVVNGFITQTGLDISNVANNLSSNYYTKANVDTKYTTLNNTITNLNSFLLNNYDSHTTISTIVTGLQNQINSLSSSSASISSNTYTKSYIDSNFATIGNLNSLASSITTVSNTLTNGYYTKTTSDDKYFAKSSISNYYTSTQTDSKYFINNASTNLVNGVINLNNLCKIYNKGNFLKLITTGSQDITGLFSDSSNYGLGIGWNYQAGSGKTAFFNCGQGSTGGFQFYSQSVYNYNLPIPSPSLILDMGYNYITCSQPLYAPDIHISSNLVFANGQITNQQLGYLRNISSDVQAQFTSIRSIINKLSGCINLYADNIINMDLKNLFTDVNYGLSIGWNYTSGGGQTALFNCGQGASGGFQFFSSPAQSYTSGTTTLILDLKPFSSTFYTPLTLTDNLIVANAAISPLELSYLDGTNGNLQNQLNNKASLTANNIWTGINNFNSPVVINSGLTLNSNLDITTQGLTGSVSISPTELSYLDGTSSNIQTQLNNKAGLTTDNSFTGVNTFTNNLYTGSFNTIKNDYTFYQNIIPGLNSSNKIVDFIFPANTTATLYLNIPIYITSIGTVSYYVLNNGVYTFPSSFDISINTTNSVCNLYKDNTLIKSLPINSNTDKINFDFIKKTSLQMVEQNTYNISSNLFLTSIKVIFDLENKTNQPQTYSIRLFSSITNGKINNPNVSFISYQMLNSTNIQTSSNELIINLLDDKLTDKNAYLKIIPFINQSYTSNFGNSIFTSGCNFLGDISFNSNSSFSTIPYYFDMPIICGVYLIIGGGIWIPIFKSLSDIGTSAIDTPTKSADGGAIVVSSDTSGINIITEDKDIAFALYPNFGVVGFQDPGMSGNKVINVCNDSSSLKIYKTINYNDKLSSIRIYYNGNIIY